MPKALSNRQRMIDQLQEYIKPIPVPVDALFSAVSGRFELDIIELDELFSKYDADYDADNASYKGKTCSMSQYVTLKYGKEANELIKRLLD